MNGNNPVIPSFSDGFKATNSVKEMFPFLCNLILSKNISESENHNFVKPRRKPEIDFQMEKG